jgi:putative ABC transport system permease protein
MRIKPDTGREVRGRFMAIDRTEFPSAAWFRRDFANESLGAMMNRLAYAENGVLVSHDYLISNNLRVGDILPVVVNIENLMSVWSEYVIVGTYNYFPTCYEEQLTMIGNLEYINTLTGLTVAHDIWMRLAPGTDTKALIKSMPSVMLIDGTKFKETQNIIAEEQGRMERVGIFGTLSIGFLATAAMAILGLLIYSYASLQERAYRLAVLNAVGLSRGQIMTHVVMEYAFLALFGAVAGALIGLLASELFVPFFRYTGEKGVPLPPLMPIIAGEQLRTLSLAFGATIIGIEVVTIASLLHQKLVQILKRVWI